MCTGYGGSRVRLLTGDAQKVLAGLPDSSADCVMTSPPYHGLRDYGVPGFPAFTGVLLSRRGRLVGGPT
jgi:DNA modification methylase